MNGIGIAVGCLCSPSLMLSLNSIFSDHPGGCASSLGGVHDTPGQTESPSGTFVAYALMREYR
jgi:hypothetical protein